MRSPSLGDKTSLPSGLRLDPFRNLLRFHVHRLGACPEYK